jgi:hypothetical protein
MAEIDIKLILDTDSINYRIGGRVDGILIDRNGNPGTFIQDLQKEFEIQPDFLNIYDGYRNHTGLRGVKGAVTGAVTGLLNKTGREASNMTNAISSKTGKMASTFKNLFNFNTPQPPQQDTPSIQEDTDSLDLSRRQMPNNRSPKFLTGGKKSKSNRSYNANKTLKNRK